MLLQLRWGCVRPVTKMLCHKAVTGNGGFLPGDPEVADFQREMQLPCWQLGDSWLLFLN